MKQQGALLAKGRLLGLQFDTLFTDQLYFEISEHAIAMAMKLKNGLHDKKYRFYLDSPTNQQFVILENSQMEELKKRLPLVSGSNTMTLIPSFALRQAGQRRKKTLTRY